MIDTHTQMTVKTHDSRIATVSESNCISCIITAISALTPNRPRMEENTQRLVCVYADEVAGTLSFKCTLWFRPGTWTI